MTRHEIFKAAHKLAKTFVGSYVACFKMALKAIYAQTKNPAVGGGSEKQNKWASDILAGWIAPLEGEARRAIDQANEGRETAEFEAKLRGYAAEIREKCLMLCALMAEKGAKFVIDNRSNCSTTYKIERDAKKHHFGI